MRSDRNLYSKSLIESQDEIAEMKRKFKIMSKKGIKCCFSRPFTMLLSVFCSLCDQTTRLSS